MFGEFTHKMYYLNFQYFLWISSFGHVYNNLPIYGKPILLVISVGRKNVFLFLMLYMFVFYWFYQILPKSSNSNALVEVWSLLEIKKKNSLFDIKIVDDIYVYLHVIIMSIKKKRVTNMNWIFWFDRHRVRNQDRFSCI